MWVVAITEHRTRRTRKRNARDAILADDDGRGTIRVRTRAHTDGIEIEVADTGGGIPTELLERVREPLFSTTSFGFGLGIPIVQRVAEEHGGRLELASRPPDGTSAVVRLPRDRAVSVREVACQRLAS